MLARYPTDTEFMKAIEDAPVTIDQWQLEKLAMATQRAEVMYCVPGLPRKYRDILWGPGFDDPARALHCPQLSPIPVAADSWDKSP